MPHLELRGIVKRFGATLALDGVDLDVDRGEVVALLGENGSGKSTLMRVLAGETRPDGGTQRLAGQTYSPRDPVAAHRAGVALIHQELALCPHLTIAENVCLGSEPGRWPLDRAAMRDRAHAALATLGHPDLDPNRRVGALPIALRQVVEIARALATGAEVLVFDEPTSSLTQEDATRLFGIVRRLRDEGRAIVYITHFLDEVPQVADRLVVLRDGRRVADGPATTPADEIIRHMVGREVADLYPRSDRTPGEPLLIIEDLVGRRRPLDATLTVHRGEVVGLAGLTGAGRTELLRAIFGLDPVCRGRLRVGAFTGPATPTAAWSARIGMVSEDRKGEGLALNMTISDNLVLPSAPAFARPDRLKRQSRAWVETLGIRCRDAGQRVGDLSGGNQQKVALARLLEARVDVLLLDEPTRGIDVGSKAQIYALIDQVAAEGKAVLLASSYLPELLGVCDRVAVMREGRLGSIRPVRETDAAEILREAARA